MEKLNPYIEENKERFLNELFELIRIPSISSEVEHKPDMYRCAEKWKSLLLAAGADKAEVYETEGNPVTYGEKIIDPSLPTVLVYGHMERSGLVVQTMIKANRLCMLKLSNIW